MKCKVSYSLEETGKIHKIVYRDAESLAAIHGYYVGSADHSFISVEQYEKETGMKFKTKRKCIFTAISKESLEKLVNDFFYSTNYYLDESDMKIKNKKNGFVKDSWIVEVKGGRYRIYKLELDK